MKMTFDLPEDLVQTIKIRAVEEGKTFKALMAELMAKGLAEFKAQKARSKEPVKTEDRP